jgi:MFS family permease
MGILGTAGTVGMALGPAIGGFVALLGFDFLFYTSSMCAFLSAAILLRLRETLPVRHKVSIDLLKIHKRDVFEPRVWATCVVMALSAYMYGTVFTVLPDFGDFVGIRNKGILFTYLTVASLLVRLVAGRASDYFGRVFVLKVSTAIIAVASIVIGFATTPVQLIGGILLYGAGQGMTSPTVFAWATDLSDENFRGRALSTLYIFMELGIGLGALVGGLFFGSNPAHLPVTFLACCLLACVAFAYLFTIRTKQPATT